MNRNYSSNKLEVSEFEEFQGDETKTQKDIIRQIKNTGNDRSKYFGNN